MVYNYIPTSEEMSRLDVIVEARLRNFDFDGVTRINSDTPDVVRAFPGFPIIKRGLLLSYFFEHRMDRWVVDARRAGKWNYFVSKRRDA